MWVLCDCNTFYKFIRVFLVKDVHVVWTLLPNQKINFLNYPVMTKHKRPEMLAWYSLFFARWILENFAFISVWFGFKFICGGVHCTYFCGW